MSVTPEQITAAHKANVESLIELSQKTFGGLEKLVGLNLQASRSVLEDSAAHSKALLAAKDAQEVLALHTALVQPASEKAIAYGEQVYEIASSTQAEVTKLVEAKVSDAQGQLQTLIDTAVKSAPAGSEPAVALVKTVVTAANSALEGVQKAAKQAASATEANFQTFSKTAVNAAKAAAQAVPKK